MIVCSQAGGSLWTATSPFPSPSRQETPLLPRGSNPQKRCLLNACRVKSILNSSSIFHVCRQAVIVCGLLFLCLGRYTVKNSRKYGMKLSLCFLFIAGLRNNAFYAGKVHAAQALRQQMHVIERGGKSGMPHIGGQIGYPCV